jgi:hypothetical protein
MRRDAGHRACKCLRADRIVRVTTPAEASDTDALQVAISLTPAFRPVRCYTM